MTMVNDANTYSLNSGESSQPLPFVSVIVPIYNGQTDVPALVQSLFAQTYPAAQVEYLLVDNGSQDETPTLLAAAVTQAKAQGLMASYLSETTIQSSYAARNRGIQAARGQILAFTDADCQPEPHWLEQLVAPFSDSAVGAVAGEILALPGNTWLEQYAERLETLSQKHTLAHSFSPYGQTANLAVRRDVFSKVGLFRPYLTTGGDADLCWRLQREGGWKIRFAEQAVVRHRHRKTLAELRSQWRRYGKSNKYLHELYDVPLMRSVSGSEIRYRLARWLLKELPRASYRVLSRQDPAIALLETPLGLYCQVARAAGQKQAQLPSEARQIVAIVQSQAPSIGAIAENLEC
ncbi:MAG: glycosyltransferase [Leptolyngbya sp. SIO1D8]|nr:glycosyltransferase [Leptolyngbya sp. SIO1D8]